jgi:hypothetical protein
MWPAGAKVTTYAVAAGYEIRIGAQKKIRIGAQKKIRIGKRTSIRIGGACGPPPPFVAPLVPRCALTSGATPRDELGRRIA